MVPDGVDGDLAGYDGIRSVTHPGPRCVETCLGGHDDGAFGVDEGVKTRRRSFENGDDRHGEKFPYSAVSQTSKTKGRTYPGNSKVLTIAFLRGIFAFIVHGDVTCR